MLIAFTIDNFLSFAHQQTLLMIPSLEDDYHNHRLQLGDFALLKTAIIYGANSSGKSNLIKAVSVGRDIIINGLDENYREYYAKTALANRERSSLFEYTFYIEGKVFTYGFEVCLDKVSISGEWLYELSPVNDREELIFRRHPQAGIFDWGPAAELKSYPHGQIDDVQNDNLLFLGAVLRRINSDGVLTVLKSVFSWFNDKLRISLHNQPYTLLSYCFPEDKDVFFSVFGKFDTGITDIVLKEIPFEILPSNIPRLGKKYMVRFNMGIYIVDDMAKTAYELLLKHHNSDFLFRFNEESDGTKRLFDYTGVIISPNEYGVYLFDEIDRSIHPLLSQKFIELFNRQLNRVPVQLVFTTHNAGLLTDDYFRRDEIWFVEKGEDNASRLFSLDIFKEKYQKPGKAYLRGDFGAIPILDKDQD
ncbi:MAG: ATP-binding protein [Bacilli bacterium]|nr:ATP-binding protein [Bacilli bacterium]MDD4077382.1 ATP-binding protein [Bacilli bacterium]